MVLWLAGINIKYFVIASITFVISAPFIISFLKPYQKLRILSFFNPDRDPLGAGYQIIQVLRLPKLVRLYLVKINLRL